MRERAASETLDLKWRTREKDESGEHYLLKIRRDRGVWLLEHRWARPSADALADAARVFSEMTGVTTDPGRLDAILELYPEARIKVALDGGARDTAARELLTDVAASFFLGSRWPSEEDEIEADLGEFLRLLRRQASAMGFGVEPEFLEEDWEEALAEAAARQFAE